MKPNKLSDLTQRKDVVELSDRRDAVVSYTSAFDRDNEGNYKIIDEEKQTASAFGMLRKVEFMEVVGGADVQEKYIRVILDSSDIRKLYKKLEEAEKVIGEEYID